MLVADLATLTLSFPGQSSDSAAGAVVVRAFLSGAALGALSLAILGAYAYLAPRIRILLGSLRTRHMHWKSARNRRGRRGT